MPSIANLRYKGHGRLKACLQVLLKLLVLPNRTPQGIQFVGFILMVGVLSGCYTTPKKATWVVTGDPVEDGYSAVRKGPPQDQNLWRYRTALTALRLGRFEDAKRLFDDAIAYMQATRFEGGGEAGKSRRMFSSESNKPFIGEPYERSMAYYYRGILYWMDGQPDNARACFRSAQLEDSDLVTKEYSGDFAIFELLDGWITQDLNGNGQQEMEKAETIARFQKPPSWSEASNLYLFVDMGYGPRKTASGDYQEKLRFVPGQSKAKAVRINVDGQPFVIGPMDDLSYQASTRGGRVMDHILGNKAVFKGTTDNVGNAALISGMVLSQNRNSRDVGLGLAAAGVVAKILASQTTPEADIRAWDNLPQYISFSAFEVPPGSHEILIEFLDSSSRPIPEYTKKAAFSIDSTRRDVVIYASDR